MTKHDTSGKCQRCQELLNWVNGSLRSWFEGQQLEDPTFHVSEGYRGKVDQNADFLAKKSKAKFGQGPHNYKPVMAIDCFWIVNGTYNGGMDGTQVLARFKNLASRLPASLEWGGNFPKGFVDGDHFQVKDWKAQIIGYPNGNV